MQSLKPRAGRPRKQDFCTEQALQDDEASRRIRMRLAQRRYRSKKQDTLAAAERKATVLETALRCTLRAYHDLQQSLLQHPPGSVHADVAVAVAVSETGLDIASLLPTTDVQIQDAFTCNLLSCYGGGSCARTIFAQRLTMHSSAELTLHAPWPLDGGGGVGAGVQFDHFGPELPAGMNVLPPGELLIVQTMGHASPHALQADLDYTGRFLPQAIQTIGKQVQASGILSATPGFKCCESELSYDPAPDSGTLLSQPE